MCRVSVLPATTLTALPCLHSAAGTVTPTTGGTMGGAGAPGTLTPAGTGAGTAGTTGMGTAGTTGTGFGGLGPAGMDTAAAAAGGLLLLPEAGLCAALVALLLSAIVLA